MPLSIIPMTLGVLGNAMSIFAYSSPIPTFRRIVKRKSVEEFSEHPYVISLLNGMLWSFYGLLKIKHGGLMVLTVNAIGCAFQYVYITLYIAFSPPHKRMVIGVLTGALHLAFVVLVLVVELLLKQPSIQLRVMGVSSCMTAVAMFASPLFIMGIVVSTKSVEYMPFLLSFSFTLRSGTWCAYGYVIQDIFIQVTNTIGVSLGLAQLVLYMMYCRSPIQKCLIKDVNLGNSKLPHNIQAMENHSNPKLSSDNLTNLTEIKCKDDKLVTKTQDTP